MLARRSVIVTVSCDSVLEVLSRWLKIIKLTFNIIAPFVQKLWKRKVEKIWGDITYQYGATLLICSRPRQSQGLLYKQLLISFIDWFSNPFPPTALRRRHVQTVRDSTSSYKIDYVIRIKIFLNHEGHQKLQSGPKVTVILLKGSILPIVGVALGRVWACSLRKRLGYILPRKGRVIGRMVYIIFSLKKVWFSWFIKFTLS